MATLLSHVPALSWPEIITRKIIKLRKFNLQFRVKTLLDFLVLKEVIIDREYENYDVVVSKNDRVIVDIGAGFGDFSISVAKRFPKAHIFAFEPNPQYFALLQENIVRNQVVNITPIKEALSSLRQLSSHLISSYPSNQMVDFMKIDCEGCEFRLIHEKSINSLRKIKKMVLEYHETGKRSVYQLEKILKQAGFAICIFPRKQVKDIGLMILNRGNDGS